MSFKTFFLLLILLAVGVWGYLRYQADGEANSRFNQTTRYSLGKLPFWRWLLRLHKVGDARSQYLNDGEPIIIEVLTARNLYANEEGLRQFASEVERVTGHKTTIVNVDVFDGQMVKNADIPQLVKNFRRHRQFGQPNIFIIYASDFEGSDLGPAKAFNEFGLLVSHSKLQNLTSQYYQVMREYLPAVLLHQFGFQLGLKESKDPNCIMQEELQQPTSALFFSGKQLPDAWCDAEINSVKKIQEDLK